MRSANCAACWSVPRSACFGRRLKLFFEIRFRRGLARFPIQVRSGEKTPDRSLLFQNRAQRPFGHVARMVRDRCILVRPGVIPDLVTSGGLTVKLESAGPELPNDLAITETREAAHLCSHHDGVVAMSRRHGKWDFAFAFAACIYKLPRYVSRDVERLGNRSPLGHKAGQFVGGGKPNSLGQLLNLDAYGEFHVNTIVPTPLRARIDPAKQRSRK
jgi:hypothetical protein